MTVGCLLMAVDAYPSQSSHNVSQFPSAGRRSKLRRAGPETGPVVPKAVPQPRARQSEALNSSGSAAVRLPVPRRLQQLFVEGPPDRRREGKGVMQGSSPRAPLESEPPVPSM